MGLIDMTLETLVKQNTRGLGLKKLNEAYLRVADRISYAAMLHVGEYANRDLFYSCELRFVRLPRDNNKQHYSALLFISPPYRASPCETCGPNYFNGCAAVLFPFSSKREIEIWTNQWPTKERQRLVNALTAAFNHIWNRQKA